MSSYRRPLALAILGLFVATVAGITLAVLATSDKGGAPAPTAPAAITIAVDGPDADRVADDPIIAGGEAPRVLEAAKQAPEKFDLGDNLRGDDTTTEGVVSGPLAAPEWPGCKTRFTPVNFSSRTAQIRGFAFHYTGSRNIVGWGDMNGLAAYAATRSAGVSWHFLVDAEGHCYYQVPISKKAWTIGNLNSQTINVEMIGNGGEATYGGSAGLRKLTAIVRRAASIYGFPVRLGAVKNCVITRPGIITHWMGGSCAGGHIDIKPYDIAAVVRTMAGSGVTGTDRATCRKLNWWRNAGRPAGQPQRNASRRKAALTARHVTCTPRGPVKA